MNDNLSLYKEYWRYLLEETHRRIRAERKGDPLPPPEEILDELRQERDAAFDRLC